MDDCFVKKSLNFGEGGLRYNVRRTGLRTKTEVLSNVLSVWKDIRWTLLRTHSKAFKLSILQRFEKNLIKYLSILTRQ